MPLDYEKAYRDAYRKNVAEVKRQLSNKELDTKVRNFCNLHDFKEKDVRTLILKYDIVAALFAKNPNTQNFYEKTAAQYIKNIKGVVDFELLPSNKLVVAGGAVMEKKNWKVLGGRTRAKTIDFTWNYKGLVFYAAHKYTKQSGGSQGNQYKDLQNFIEEALPCTKHNTRFIAIADGDFYGGQNGLAGRSRIDYLKHLASNQVVYACTIDELERLLQKITG